MVVSEFVFLKWNSKNFKKYTELGYAYTKMGDEFKVKIEDLGKYSRCNIIIKCDYCGLEYEVRYDFWSGKKIKGISKKDACTNCVNLKIKDSFKEKYGLENPYGLPEIVEKRKETCIEKYGEDNPSKVDFIKEKIIEVQIEKYGSLYVRTDEYKKRYENTCLQRYGVKNKMNLVENRKYGENNPRWKGVSLKPNFRPTALLIYKEWRFSVFKRDSFLCQRCFVKKEVEAHHIKNWRDNEELRYDVNNGITLCKQCHKDFHIRFGKRETNENQLQEFIKQYDKNVCRTIENEQSIEIEDKKPL